MTVRHDFHFDDDDDVRLRIDPDDDPRPLTGPPDPGPEACDDGDDDDVVLRPDSPEELAIDVMRAWHNEGRQEAARTLALGCLHECDWNDVVRVLRESNLPHVAERIIETAEPMLRSMRRCDDANN